MKTKLQKTVFGKIYTKMKTSSYESKIISILKKDNIRFLREKTFSDLRGGRFRYDFFIEDLYGARAIIEMNGQYHFKPIRGRAQLLKQQQHDREKYSYALTHGIKLYAIPYWEIDNIKTSKDLFQDKFLVQSKWHDDELRRNM